MSLRLTLVFCLLASIVLPWPSSVSAQTISSTCLNCHASKQDGFNPAHAFAATNCTACHAGDNKASTIEGAHADLLAFPGELVNAQRACGNCHADRVSSVTENLMHLGRGMVHVTRQALDESVAPDTTSNLQSLGHGVADSMLRKQCASCHIGQTKTEHRSNVMWDRGGGCNACHLDEYPETAHVALTASVSDARCFGCHARSGRISLNYTGIAEIDVSSEPGTESGLRLPDGRHIERKSGDVHYLAGMSCIDCHTNVGLMGGAGDALHQRQGVDIACADCHDNDNERVSLSDWPSNMASMRKRLPFPAGEKSVFLATGKNGTPLWHVELRDDGAWLHTKNTGRILKIPTPKPARHALNDDHERLACVTCHSQWAPQCFGCHMEYDPDGEQWDHVERAVTPGRWSNERWHVRNELPALGVNEDNRIELFVPGMVMTVEHPDWEEQKFVRMFAPLSPHTTGKSRTCESCHRSSVALGLGQGQLTIEADEHVFTPTNQILQDGLPADAWTNIGNSLGGRAPSTGQRPLDKAEIEAILNAPISPVGESEPAAR